MPRQLRIALIEDNPADAEILRFAFEQTGVPVEIAAFETGTRAIEFLQQNSAFDLVLLDLNLPMITGLDVLDMIRSNPRLRRLPVVVFSGSNSLQEINRCYDLGASSYVRKPGQLSEILAMADQFVTYWTRCAELPAVSEPEMRYSGAAC